MMYDDVHDVPPASSKSIIADILDRRETEMILMTTFVAKPARRWIFALNGRLHAKKNKMECTQI